MKVLITGSNGFIGATLADALEASGTDVVRAVRNIGLADIALNEKWVIENLGAKRPHPNPLPLGEGSSGLAAAGEGYEPFFVQRNNIAVGDIDATTDWSAALNGCDAVVHLAACVHMGTSINSTLASNLLAMEPPRKRHVLHVHSFSRYPSLRALLPKRVNRGAQMNPDNADHAPYHSTNVEGTVNLARQALQAGIKRFVFISSAKVHGEGRMAAYHELDTPCPQDAYATSKWEAEQQLHALAKDAAMECVILRPPLVYGAGVGANFLALMRLVARGIPLPFGCIRNQRSLIFVHNLVDAIRHCLIHPAAAHQTFLVADEPPLSTPELTRAIAHAQGKRVWLLPVPVQWLQKIGVMAGQSAQISRLTESFMLDTHHIQTTLGWEPPYTTQEGLAQTARWYQNHAHSS
jgi:nucleoside-diphosphate-sugar epimerase